MDRRQNNGSVKVVSPRHCPATCALRNCSFNCCAGQSLRQCPLHRCWRTTWTTQSKRRPTCSAQLHLPTHDLFWAKVRVQLHLPPLRSLDLLISPGTPVRSQPWTSRYRSMVPAFPLGPWHPQLWVRAVTPEKSHRTNGMQTRGFHWTLAHVWYCLIKTSYLFNLLCVFILI